MWWPKFEISSNERKLKSDLEDLENRFWSIASNAMLTEFCWQLGKVLGGHPSRHIQQYDVPIDDIVCDVNQYSVQQKQEWRDGSCIKIHEVGYIHLPLFKIDSLHFSNLFNEFKSYSTLNSKFMVSVSIEIDPRNTNIVTCKFLRSDSWVSPVMHKFNFELWGDSHQITNPYVRNRSNLNTNHYKDSKESAATINRILNEFYEYIETLYENLLKQKSAIQYHSFQSTLKLSSPSNYLKRLKINSDSNRPRPEYYTIKWTVENFEQFISKPTILLQYDWEVEHIVEILEKIEKPWQFSYIKSETRERAYDNYEDILDDLQSALLKFYPHLEVQQLFNNARKH